MKSYQQRFKRSAAILNKKYCIYMIPALLSAVGVSLSEFADSMIVGQLLSEKAFAIVNLGIPIVFMASTVYTITGMGGSLLYAEYLAKKEKESADTFFTASMLLALLLGLVLFAAIIYRGDGSVNDPTNEEKELIDYALKTVCALGITDGPVHGEYMIDKNGPVLIKANCRVMGSSAPSGFLDKVFGYHETEVILNSMLDKEYHRKFLQRPYKPLRKGYVKDFSASCDQPISSSGIVPILLGMKSFYSGWVENAGRTDMLHETVDLETETGCIYMVHDDPEVVEREFEMLMYIEDNYPKLFQSDEPLFLPPEDASRITPEIESVLNEDTEVLISRIMSWYKAGAQGESVVPEALLEASPYNRRIMELLRSFC